MSLIALDGLTASQRDLLAITSKTEFLTDNMLEMSSFSDNAVKDLKALAAAGFLDFRRQTDEFHIELKYSNTDALHLLFLEIEPARRREICQAIAENYFKKNETLLGLMALSACSDRAAFTKVFLEQTIEIASDKAADQLLKLVELILLETKEQEFAYSTIKIAARLWRGDYLIAESLLNDLEHQFNSGKYPPHFLPGFTFLKGINYQYMGRLSRSKPLFEEFFSILNDKVLINPRSVILAARGLSNTALWTHDVRHARHAEDIARAYQTASDSPQFKYHLTQIEAVRLYVEGDLNAAYEKSVTAIAIAKEFGYEGKRGPIESLVVKASCEEEFMEHSQAAQTWERIGNLAEASRLPVWRCISHVRKARCQHFLNPFVDVLNAVQEARLMYEALPHQHDLDLIVDLEELFVAYRLGNSTRARTLLARLPSSPRTLEVELVIDLVDGQNPDVGVLSQPTVRNRLMTLLVKVNSPQLSEATRKTLVAEILDLADTYGWYRMICVQEDRFVSEVVRAAALGHSAYQERLARLVASMQEKKQGKLPNIRIDLTSRESEVLALLAAGYKTQEICDQLALSKNTVKTHQKNLYKKLESSGRQEAVANAKKLGLLA